MAKHKKKKPTTTKIDWTHIFVQAVVGFIVGFLLLIVAKYI